MLGVILLGLVMAGTSFALPARQSVQRSAEINALEADIFPYLNDLRKFNTWSPWAARDPEAHYVFEGAARGKGARMDWNSEKVGLGTMEIVESEPNRSVTVHLDFGLQGKAEATYRLTPSGAGTKVTWGFETAVGNNPLRRWMGLMFDRWIGADYEEGLERLKKLVESGGRGQ
jgi:carbon monoxide dehydrogenase subunit G